MSEATATTTASDGGSIGPRVPGLDGDGSIGDPGSQAQGPLGPWVPGPGSIGTPGPRPRSRTLVPGPCGDGDDGGIFMGFGAGFP